MKKILLLALSVLVIGGVTWTAAAQQPPKQDAKDAGSDLKDAGKSTGRAAKSTGKIVKKTAKKRTNKTARSVRKGSEKVEDKTQP